MHPSQSNQQQTIFSAWGGNPNRRHCGAMKSVASIPNQFKKTSILAGSSAILANT
jgi:hypothetical protein